MPFAIELYFNAEAEIRLRSLWNALVHRGVRPERHNASRPHVSLAVSEGVDVEKASRLVSKFASAHEQFPLTFQSLGVFPGKKSILFLAPKVTPELLALQAKFFSVYPPVAHGIWEHYLVDRWNPHCTLTRGLKPDQLCEAIDECSSFELPFSCTVVELGLVALRPVCTRFVAPFQFPHTSSTPEPLHG